MRRRTGGGGGGGGGGRRSRGRGSGRAVRPECIIPSYTGGKKGQGNPPDLASYLFAERIVYLGLPLVPSVTELIVAELLWLNYEDRTKPITMYINSTGIMKDGQKLAYDSEAMAIYDTMSYIRNPITTVAVGNAWGEAGMLLAAGTRGKRAALPSASIMIHQPQGAVRGQATDLDIYRRETRKMRGQMLEILARHTGKTVEELDKDTNRPLYFSPEDAVEYGVIDKVRLCLCVSNDLCGTCAHPLCSLLCIRSHIKAPLHNEVHQTLINDNETLVHLSSLSLSLSLSLCVCVCFMRPVCHTRQVLTYDQKESKKIPEPNT